MPGVELSVTIEDVTAERLQARRRGESHMTLAVGSTRGQAEEILVAAQRGIVVVLAGRVVGARHYVLGVQQNRTDTAAPWVGTGCRRWREVEDLGQEGAESWKLPVRAGLLVAAGRRISDRVALVEGDHDEHLSGSVGLRGENQRYPVLQP